MHLVQILLPIDDRAGNALPSALFREVRRDLVARFGGLTTYTRAPAKGLWNEGSGVDRDDIVVYEVMVTDLDRVWWSQYRTALAQRFDQEELLVRALATEKL
jgi:hypothetical protein